MNETHGSPQSYGDPLTPLPILRLVRRCLMAWFNGEEVPGADGRLVLEGEGQGPLVEVSDDEVVAMVRALPVAERVNLIYDVAAALMGEAIRSAVVVSCQPSYATGEAGWRGLSLHAHQLLSGLYGFIPQVFQFGEDTWGERTKPPTAPPSG